ncbi:MAG: diguanylate cyclase [Actinomycetota bacterium]
MSLQRRLTVFFIVIVIIPLAVAGIVVQRIVGQEIARRAELSLDPALEAASTAYVERADSLELRVREAARHPDFGPVLERAGKASLSDLLAQLRADVRGLDFLIVTDSSGETVGNDVVPGAFLEGYSPAGVAELARPPSGGAPFINSTVTLRGSTGKQFGQLVGGFWLDRDLLVGYTPEMVNLSMVAGDEVIATTAPVRRVISVAVDSGRFETVLDQEVTAKSLFLQDDLALVATTPHTQVGGLSTQVVLVGLLLLAAMGTAIIGYWLARLITHPLEQLSDGAQAITDGNFDHRIPVRSHDEVGRVAIAFNEMTARLRETINELSSSRNQLERAVRRVGETLRSTHDMKQMLESIVNTAADAVRADAAVLWMFTATRESVYPAIIRGVVGGSMESIRVGDGIAGQVAERGNSIVLPSDDIAPRRARGEPDFPVAAAIPLYSQARLMGVMTIYRKDPEDTLTRSDVDTMIFLAEQGGVAIENVLLHEDAQRLSLTDGLTGVWNRRYFQMQFRQILATASRFDRPFSIMMLDLDHFKRVNDTHGHQRGDAILVEFSQRVSGALREIDTFARYGGEEFICLLAETGLGGAATTAEKIREVIKSKPFGGMGDEPISLTVSIGVASYPEHGDSFRGLVEAADQALYRAKQEGRDRVRTAGSQLKLAT